MIRGEDPLYLRGHLFFSRNIADGLPFVPHLGQASYALLRVERLDAHEVSSSVVDENVEWEILSDRRREV